MKIVSFDNLESRVRASVGKVVHCHGVFDVLHVGHLQYLRSAKKHGQTLVVTVTADQFVNKGPARPYFSESIRAEMLAAIELVDVVAISPFPTAVPAIEKIRPDFYVKGPDYKDMSKDVTGEIYKEVQAVESNNGRVVFTDDETFSSSTLANKFFVSWSEDQLVVIETIKQKGAIARIDAYLDEISNCRVSIIGEPIIDTYRFCEPQNISSKSPSISAKFLYEENYEGGALAIQNHLKDFVKRCDLVLPQIDRAKWPRKIRYISQDKQQRIFEVTHIDQDAWNQTIKAPISKHLNTEYDTVLLADFGHGLFDEWLLGDCENLKNFVGLNVQTNSSNYGFNPYHKHKRFDYLSIDKRELQVAFHDNETPPLKLSERIESKQHSVTLGPNGAVYRDSNKLIPCPAFADNIVDATGAGDAYFAITSLLVKIGAEPEFIPFIGNVYAGLKTKIIGNKTSVTKAQLLKALASILK